MRKGRKWLKEGGNKMIKADDNHCEFEGDSIDIIAQYLANGEEIYNSLNTTSQVIFLMGLLDLIKTIRRK